MTQSILKLTSIRVDLYVDADVCERCDCKSFDDSIKFVNDIVPKLYVPLDSLESFVSITYNNDTVYSYSMYSAKSLVMLLNSFSITYKITTSLNKKGIFKNGKKKS